MEIREVTCQNILNRSAIADYCINPYTGCQHSCCYCYARFVARYVGKRMKDWAKFVYPKINAGTVLSKQIKRALIIISATKR